jgi:hypothetical protein
MNEIIEQVRVYVSNECVSGTGTVVYVSNEAFSPVQVELDQPDEDGHRMHRFYHTEVKPLDSIQGNVSEKEWIVDLIHKMPGHSLRAGERFTAKPTRSRNDTHYLIYKQDKLRGCFPTSCFKVIQECTVSIKDSNRLEEFIPSIEQTDICEQENRIDQVISEAKVIDRVKERQKQVKNPTGYFEVMEAEGQTSIFDFI